MIQDKLKLIPHEPGCYLMKNINNNIIYVGKSKNLKNRVTSYFNSKKSGKTAKLVSEIVDFEYIITNTEVESLILEINLIKKYNPKYNILLTDDKTYPYIELTNEKIPRLIVLRNINLKKNKKNYLFGPYPNVTSARKTVDLINRLYPLRKCKNLGKKVCLYYHIEECLGYCSNKIDDELIDNMRKEIISFLNGNDDVIISKIKAKMNRYSSIQEYEKALEYRNLLNDILTTIEDQKVDLDDNLNKDIIGYYYHNNYVAINTLFIRGGKLIDQNNHLYPIIDDLDEELNTYISLFYNKNTILPNEVITTDNVNIDLLNDSYSSKFIIPKKGKKKDLLDLSITNAKNYYQEQISLIVQNSEKTNQAISNLKELLNLNKLDRIELFDNSHLFGTYNVSGMVVFEDLKFKKNEYRKYKIISESKDDYTTMKEVIYRRYFRLLKEKTGKPDLIIVDGGLGQVNVACDVLRDLNLDILVCGLKKDNHHNTNLLITSDREIDIDKTSDLFHLLTKMQDEIHNYTISYHKQIRGKGLIESVLDNVDGIGEIRKKELLKKYQNIENMKKASLDELSNMMPKNIALNLYNYLHQ